MLRRCSSVFCKLPRVRRMGTFDIAQLRHDSDIFVKNKLTSFSIGNNERREFFIHSPYGYYPHFEIPQTFPAFGRQEYQEFSSILSNLENQWKTQEIDNNDLGFISHMRKYKSFDTEYNNLTKSMKQQIDYFTIITKLMCYFEKMNRKYTPTDSVTSVDALYDNGFFTPFRSAPSVRSYDMIGLDELRGIFTPIGSTGIKSLPYPRDKMIAAGMRDDAIKQRLKTIRIDRNPLVIESPYMSITRGLDGETFSEIEFDITDDYNEYRKFWKTYRDLIFDRTMKSIDKKPIKLD
jgi:hypothetical protein